MLYFIIVFTIASKPNCEALKLTKICSSAAIMLALAGLGRGVKRGNFLPVCTLVIGYL